MASGAAPAMGSNLCFKNGQTHSTGDISPPLSWSNPPAGTMSFAVSLHDTSNGITHWVMWDIPANVTSLAPMLPSGAMPGPPAPTGSTQRGASFVGADQYAGPGAGPPVHAYAFTVWAMSSTSLSIAAGDSTDTIYTQDLRGSSIGSATLLVCGDQSADCATCTDGGN
jgi:Raf kinase inhibitor-like YbhB/YbcL family protein